MLARWSTWRRKAWLASNLASGPGVHWRSARPTPWPAPEACWALGDVRRRSSHGMSADIKARLRQQGLRSMGPHAPADFPVDPDALAGLSGDFAAPSLKTALRLAARATNLPRQRKSKRCGYRRHSRQAPENLCQRAPRSRARGGPHRRRSSARRARRPWLPSPTCLAIRLGHTKATGRRRRETSIIFSRARLKFSA